MERCPICRARLTEISVCPRCTTDLSLPLIAEQQAESLCFKSLMLLENGQLNEAIEVIEQSIQFKNDPLTLQLRGFFKSMN